MGPALHRPAGSSLDCPEILSRECANTHILNLASLRIPGALIARVRVVQSVGHDGWPVAGDGCEERGVERAGCGCGGRRWFRGSDSSDVAVLGEVFVVWCVEDLM